VTVVGYSSGLQLSAGLFQQGLGFGGMSSHIPLIGSLGIRDTVIGLVKESLSVCEDRMPVRVDIAVRRTLRDCRASDDKGNAQ